MNRPVQVLLVDDDRDVASWVGELFAQLPSSHYGLTVVRSLDEARALLGGCLPDLILLDYRIGAESGLKLLRHLAATLVSLPVILLTGEDRPGIDEESLRMGAVDFIVKSELTPARLDRSIRFALERQRAQQLERERAVLQDASTALSQLVNMLQHELRTPLAGMRATIEQSLSADWLRAEPRGADLIHALGGQVEAMLQAVNAVMQAANGGGEKHSLNWQSFGLGSLMDQVVADVRRRFEGAHVAVTGAVAPANLTMRGDAQSLHHLLLGILSSAYWHSSGGPLRVEIGDEQLAEGRWIVITIRYMTLQRARRDNGRAAPNEAKVAETDRTLSQTLLEHFAIDIHGGRGEQWINNGNAAGAGNTGVSVRPESVGGSEDSGGGGERVVRLTLAADLPGPASGQGIATQTARA